MKYLQHLYIKALVKEFSGECTAAIYKEITELEKHLKLDQVT